MKKHKICVYAICKNEENFVDRFVDSMSEADAIYVLDTGSTDKTVSKLKKRGVDVSKKEIVPWRFDVARNEALKLVPDNYDYCISVDLDEVFEPGWRNKLEQSICNNTTRVRFTYHWSLDEKDQPRVTFYYEKCHTPKNYSWINPVHEVLKYTGENEIITTCDAVVLKHYPDNNKLRSSYLPLLELAIKEDPSNDRNMHYLGREYMYHKKWNQAIDTLIKHLSLKSATWKDERAASMRFIGRCYIELHRFEEANFWFNKAITEAPYLRDAYIEKAILAYQLQDWQLAENLCMEALKITTHQKTYINEVFSWNETVYDILSIACFYNGKIDEALNYIDCAIEINDRDPRLKKNKEIIESFK